VTEAWAKSERLKVGLCAKRKNMKGHRAAKQLTIRVMANKADRTGRKSIALRKKRGGFAKRGGNAPEEAVKLWRPRENFKTQV